MKVIKKNLPEGVKKMFGKEKGIKVKYIAKDPAVKTGKQKKTEQNKCVRKDK